LDGFYERLAVAGWEIGPAVRCGRVAGRGGEGWWRVVARQEDLTVSAGRFGLHPALLDAALQSANLGAAPVARPGDVLLPYARNHEGQFASGATPQPVHPPRVGPDSLSIALTHPVGR
ncbi:hypothetical protein PUR61_19320, partial [Streptomyces sp. BE20]|uniref:polyketide synthase dehydratase domain-containing protein n=1 Tax=Streptomyces sp. BE20 TaxID=3002525 RepID=UPI002E75A721